MRCIIRMNFVSLKDLMIELTLLTLLNYVGDNFCEYRNLGHDNYKSLLLSYSDASNKFGPLEVKKVIEKSENFKAGLLINKINSILFIIKLVNE